jgi:maltose alpha-D-glucosyltransferase/alpha-amylase
MGEGRAVATPGGEIRFSARPDWPAISPEAQIRAIGAEQSNVSVVVDERIMLKMYRRVRSGVQPELEVARFLTETAGFSNTPEFLGAVEEVHDQGESMALAIAFSFVPNQGDAWNAVVEALDRKFEDLMLVGETKDEAGETTEEPYVFPLDIAVRLHWAFATTTSDPAFAAEAVTKEDIELWSEKVREETEHVFSQLQSRLTSLSGETEELVSRLLDARDAVREKIESISRTPPFGAKTRIHGDYHLGQVLIAQDDVVIVDFEGEPSRPLAERREKSSPLRDVAGMLRSLDYAASAAIERFTTRTGETPERIVTAAADWRDRASQGFLQAYFAAAPKMAPRARKAGRGLLDLFLLQKAFYEIHYEMMNRPAWLPIPVRGVLGLLRNEETSPS